jgi:AcrR family transcriptional regulator
MNVSTRKQVYDSRRQIARRTAILEATRELISKRGYEGTTVRDVAQLAGVAKSTLYNIYGGKDDLIFAAVVDVRDDIRDRTLELAPEPGLDSILKAEQAVVEQIVSRPTYVEAISRALFGASPATMLVPSLIDTPIQLTRRELESAKDAGEIQSDVDCEVLARLLVMQRWGLIMAWSLKQISLEQTTHEMSHAIVRLLDSIALPQGRRMLEKYFHDAN